VATKIKGAFKRTLAKKVRVANNKERVHSKGIW